eukprot:Colp12_sorted_trinity150504_noHs@8554
MDKNEVPISGASTPAQETVPETASTLTEPTSTTNGAVVKSEVTSQPALPLGKKKRTAGADGPSGEGEDEKPAKKRRVTKNAVDGGSATSTPKRAAAPRRQTKATTQDVTDGRGGKNTESNISRSRRMSEALQKQGIKRQTTIMDQSANRNRIKQDMKAAATEVLITEVESSSGGSESEDEGEEFDSEFEDWWGFEFSGSDDDIDHASDEGDALRHAGVWTEEEMLFRRKEQLIRLKALYKSQYYRLHEQLRRRHKKYLRARSATLAATALMR